MINVKILLKIILAFSDIIFAVLHSMEIGETRVQHGILFAKCSGVATGVELTLFGNCDVICIYTT